MDAMVFTRQQRCPGCGTQFEFCGFSDRIRFGEYDQLCTRCQEKNNGPLYQHIQKIKPRKSPARSSR